MRGESLGDIKYVYTQISGKFKVKDMDEFHYFLVIEVQTPNEKLLFQYHYIPKLLFNFGMAQCKPIMIPLDCKLSCTKTPPQHVCLHSIDK